MGADLATFGMIPAAAAASIAGSELGIHMGGSSSSGSALTQDQQYINGTTKSMNTILQQALQNAMGTYNQNSAQAQQAISQAGQQAQQSYTTGLNNSTNALNTGLTGATSALNTGLTGATSALNSSLAAAIQAAQSNVAQGFSNSQALQQPYATLGYNASDMYADSLGLARPQIGSAALANNEYQYSNTLNPQIKALQAAAQANNNSPWSTSPTAPTPFALPAQSAPGAAPKSVNFNAAALQNQMNVAGAAIQSLQEQMTRPAAQQNKNIMANLQSQLAQYSQQYQGAAQAISQGQAQIAQINASQMQAYNQSQQTNAANYQQQVQAVQQQNQQQQNLYNAQNGAYSNLQNSLKGFNPMLLQQAIAASRGQFNPTQSVNVGIGGIAPGV